jgi:hypothetical protein
VVDVYEGDFSTVELKKDRYAASSIGYILDESLWKKSILIPRRGDPAGSARPRVRQDDPAAVDHRGPQPVRATVCSSAV